MYTAIFKALKGQFPGASLATVSRLFQFIAYSHRTLEIAELHHTISVPLNQAQTKSDIVPRFTKSLSSLSGSLLKILNDGTVRFIHLSAQEYFIEKSREQQTNYCRLLTSKGLAHRNIAATYLSYLCHTVPHRPLGGSSQTVPSAVIVSTIYPLLKYTVESWGCYLPRTFKHIPRRQESQAAGDVSWEALAALLRQFLRAVGATTLWIKACFLYGVKPTVPNLPDFKSVIRPLLETERTALKLFQGSIKDLQEFDRDLTVLHQSWSYILIHKPNEIWEPSIPAFTKSQFWLSTTKARSRGLLNSPGVSSTTEKDFIITRSQLSQCGTEMGVVKLFPPW